ncbi:MAG: LysE family translocator [Rhodobacteraceae bacterium]|nr:LysE family translocator [Paracoccaceae bacterium]
MTLQLFSALVLFAFVSSITPGPNNLMLLASGANFGFRRTIPHMLGISLGHAVMVSIVGIGLVEIFDRVPQTYSILAIASAIYLLWLAWKIAHAAEPGKGRESGTPMTFLQAALFQWVNPKAWYMALTAITLYAADRTLAGVITVALVFACVNLPSVSTWALLGQQIRRILTNPTRLRVFNWTMALLLIASLVPVLLP